MIKKLTQRFGVRKVAVSAALASGLLIMAPIASGALESAVSTSAQVAAATPTSLVKVSTEDAIAAKKRAEQKAQTARAKARAAAKAKAARKAAKARAARAAQRKRLAALSLGGTPEQNKALGRAMCLDAGFSAGQCADLIKLWQKESGWNHKAYNGSSGAAGIPQALPGSKMSTIAADWRTNPATQIAWGLGYIKSRYGNPSAAWAHSVSYNWY